MNILRRMLLILAILIFTPLIGFVAYLTLYQTRLILPGVISIGQTPDIPYQPLTVTAKDGTQLHGILFPATTASSTLILAFPGNAQDAVSFATHLKKIFPEPSIAIAALSYRGYTNALNTPSEGRASQAAMYQDAETLYDTLTTDLKPTSTSIVAYSIGTTVATHLATVRPIARMALMAPLASIRRIVQRKYPWLPVRLLLRNPFANEDIIAGLKTPTTIIYSPTDGLVPETDVTEILHSLNPAIPLIAVPGTNHVNLDLHPDVPGYLRTAITP